MKPPRDWLPRKSQGNKFGDWFFVSCTAPETNVGLSAEDASLFKCLGASNRCF